MAHCQDIFDRLKADHRRQRALLDRLGGDAEPGSERRELFEAFTFEAKAHAAAEEQALYSTILRKPALTACGRHSVAEHRQIEELLNDLAATDPGDARWLSKFRQLDQRYRHHIDEEETEMFPRFDEVLTDEDAIYMRQVFERRKPIETIKAEITPEPLEQAEES
ncbi:MAG: hemerythrin domain-containing protein [Novosphingobium sp.]|nr:hemerythrin domain-containing protein [Novosphingobium sp.]